MEKGSNKKTVLSSALLVYMVVVVLMITLMPFNFRIPEKLLLLTRVSIPDFIRNILLFIPIGFLHRLSRRRNPSSSCTKELLMGIALSFLIESLQFFLPERYSSPADILANGAGAWVGAGVYTVISRILDEENAYRLFALEMPLMSIAYFLGPLLWLSGLSNDGHADRLTPLLLLGVFGAGIFAATYNHRLICTTKLTGTAVSIAATGWFLFFSIPTLLKFPLHVAGIGGFIFFFVIFQIRLSETPDDKRFEVKTIKSVLPFYIVYLCLLMHRTPFLKLPEWKLPIGFHYRILPPGFMEFSFIEFLAAFTLLGYITAMIHTRSPKPLPGIIRWVLGVPLCVTLFSVMQRGTQLSLLSIAFPFLSGAAFSLYGVLIYRLQLAAIKRTRPSGP